MSPKKPNVLWIMCDELRSDAVGVYGNEYAPIETPNTDSIAEKGVRFDRFYVDSPVCVSARSAYKSGLLPTSTGIYHNHGRGFGAAVPVESFTEIFTRAGYRTVNLGKEHVPNALLIQPHTSVIVPEPWASKSDDAPWPDSFDAWGSSQTCETHESGHIRRTYQGYRT